jgi:hypothetical protein
LQIKYGLQVPVVARPIGICADIEFVISIKSAISSAKPAAVALLFVSSVRVATDVWVSTSKILIVFTTASFTLM